VAKARQKSVNKEWKGGSTTSEERLYVDISSIKGNSFGGAKFSISSVSRNVLCILFCHFESSM
jgi:hypothetical protein